jgi:hypothetical protein
MVRGLRLAFFIIRRNQMNKNSKAVEMSLNEKANLMASFAIIPGYKAQFNHLRKPVTVDLVYARELADIIHHLVSEGWRLHNKINIFYPPTKKWGDEKFDVDEYVDYNSLPINLDRLAIYQDFFNRMPFASVRIYWRKQSRLFFF